MLTVCGTDFKHVSVRINMEFWYTVETAMKGLGVHKMRSLLTVVGIVIGVSAVMIVMSLGQGAQNLIVGQIGALGAETAVIQPKGGDSFFPDFFSQNITERDFEAINKKANVPNLVASMPEVVISAPVSYKNETYRPGFIIGGTADYFIETFDIYPSAGVPFSESDIRAQEKVALIGETVKEELFGQNNAVGELIKIKGHQFRVVGIFPQKGSLVFFNLDDLVLIPYTTAQTYLLGTNYYNQINVRADDADNIDKLVYDIEATMRETHNIGPGEEDDFQVQTQQGLVEQISVVTSIMTAFIALVAAISLVVGGIGIMNVMLVSVTERTKEIGLRKALGATRKDILRQFLIEAVLLTGTGGLIGVLLGTLVSFTASVILSQTVAVTWEFVFPFSAVFLGIGVSAFVGLVFGIYPAMQAADKSPIEALRYE